MGDISGCCQRAQLLDERSLFGPLRGTDHVVRLQTSCNSFVRSEHGPFVRGDRVRIAVALNGGPGRPSGHRVSALTLMTARTMARLRTLRTMVWFVAIFSSLMLLSGAVHAERAALNAQKAAALPPDPFAAFI